MASISTHKRILLLFYGSILLLCNLCSIDFSKSAASFIAINANSSGLISNDAVFFDSVASSLADKRQGKMAGAVGG